MRQRPRRGNGVLNVWKMQMRRCLHNYSIFHRNHNNNFCRNSLSICMKWSLMCACWIKCTYNNSSDRIRIGESCAQSSIHFHIGTRRIGTSIKCDCFIIFPAYAVCSLFSSVAMTPRKYAKQMNLRVCGNRRRIEFSHETALRRICTHTHLVPAAASTAHGA